MASKSIVWEYIGDMKCPCCGRYSKVEVHGHHSNRIMRLQCKTTGNYWFKDVGLRWLSLDEYYKLYEEAQSLKRGARAV